MVSAKKEINLRSFHLAPGGGGESKIFKQDGEGLLKSFTEAKKSALGQRAEDIIAEDRDTLREQRRRLREAEIQLKQAEKLSEQRAQEKRQVEALRQKIEQTDAKLDGIQDEHGSNLESGEELRRLKQLKKSYQTDLENRKKSFGLAHKKSNGQRKGTGQG